MRTFKEAKGRTTITKTGKGTYTISTETPIMSIITDIVSLVVVCVILCLFGGKSMIWDVFAIVFIFLFARSFAPKRKRLTKEELIKELEEIEQ